MSDCAAFKKDSAFPRRFCASFIRVNAEPSRSVNRIPAGEWIVPRERNIVYMAVKTQKDTVDPKGHMNRSSCEVYFIYPLVYPLVVIANL